MCSWSCSFIHWHTTKLTVNNHATCNQPHPHTTHSFQFVTTLQVPARARRNRSTCNEVFHQEGTKPSILFFMASGLAPNSLVHHCAISHEYKSWHCLYVTPCWSHRRHRFPGLVIFTSSESKDAHALYFSSKLHYRHLLPWHEILAQHLSFVQCKTHLRMQKYKIGQRCLYGCPEFSSAIDFCSAQDTDAYMDALLLDFHILSRINCSSHLTSSQKPWHW